MQENFSECTKKAESVIIYADSREDAALISLIERAGCIVKTKLLDVGDYIVSDRAVVERKTRMDFESSLIDGRLFDQASRISSAYERVVYIIEGKSFANRINRNALMAAISSLILNNGISVFFTRNMNATAELIAALAKKEQVKSKRTILIKKPVKTSNINRQLLYVVSALPGIGDLTAEKLLLHFRTLSNLFSATEQEIASVKGIGKKRARELARFIRTEFNKIS